MQGVSESDYWPKPAQIALPQELQELQNRFLFEDIDSFLFLPELQNETYSLVCPQTTIIQGGLRGTPTLLEEDSVVVDAPLAAKLNTSNTICSIVSSSSALKGKRKSDQLLACGRTSRAAACTQIKPSYAVAAECKSREKMRQRFIALSAVIPNLRKTDKATILGDAIKHVKQLQEKLKVLSDQANSRNLVQCASSSEFSRGRTLHKQQNTSLGEHSNHIPEDPVQFSKVHAHMFHETLLINVHCERKKGLVVKIIAELEERHLYVSNMQILSFSQIDLHLTLIAQVQERFDLTAERIEQALQSLLRSYD